MNLSVIEDKVVVHSKHLIRGLFDFSQQWDWGLVFFVDPHPPNTMQREAPRSQLWRDMLTKMPHASSAEYYSIYSNRGKSIEVNISWSEIRSNCLIVGIIKYLVCTFFFRLMNAN